MIKHIKTLRTQQKEEGFTLIELMIVVVIIGILSAIAIPIFMNQQKAAIQAGIKSDVRNLHQIFATYLVKNPTATNLTWRKDYGSAAPTGTLAADPYFQQLTANFKPSQETTILVIRGAADISTVGAWNQYYILGANIKEGQETNSSAYYRFYFDSETGKYEERY